MGSKKRKDRKLNSQKGNGAVVSHRSSESKRLSLGEVFAVTPFAACLVIFFLIRRQSFQQPNDPITEAAQQRAQSLYRDGMHSLYDNHIQQSFTHFDNCIAVDPQNVDCYNSKAGAQRMLGQSQAALATLYKGEAAITDPLQLAQLYSSTFLLLKDLRHPEKAIEYMERAIEIQPTANRYFNWATLEDSHEKQVELYTRALNLDPNFFPAFCRRFNSYYLLGKWELIEQDYEKVMNYQQALIDEDAQQLNTNSSSCLLPYYTTYMDISPKLMKDTAIQFAKRQATMSKESVLPRLHPYTHISPVFDEDGNRIRKLRIGYVSGDLSVHPVGRNVLGLFMAHNTAKFEVYAFSTKHKPTDSITKAIQQNTPQVTYVDISQIHDFFEIAKLIRNEYRIDVLIDLNGWTDGHVMKMFGARPAPVQITHGLGFVGTVGTPSFDYFISDHVASPAMFDSYYTESLIRLPQAYLPASHATVHLTPLGQNFNPTTANKTQLRLDNELPTTASFVFCNFQGIHRIGRESYETWLRILSKIPSSILWMAQRDAKLRKRLLQRATEYGITNASSRILFSNHTNPGKHLVRAQACDLHLDSWPYNAHSTGVDVLWAGVPLLAFLADYHNQSAAAVPKMASRVSTSLLDTLGMPHLITSSIEAYEEQAVRYAMDRAAYTRLRNELLEKRLTSPLFDLISYARVHEDAYLRSFQQFMNKQKPEPIDIERYQQRPATVIKQESKYEASGGGGDANDEL